MKDGMKQELVSIITPMYNAERFVGQMIQSVQAQTYTEWELIIVDDGSTDQSVSIVREYQQNDSRIHLYLQHQNQGVAAARNRAIAEMHGRWIAFLDSDDLWRKEKLERQLCFQQKGNFAFTYTSCDVMDESGRSLGKPRLVPTKRDYQELLYGNVIPCLTVMLDCMQLPQIQMPKLPHEDYATWLTLLKSGLTAYGMTEILADYRVNTRSLSANKWRAIQWTWQIYRQDQKLGRIKSFMCLTGYVLHGIRKRVG